MCVAGDKEREVYAWEGGLKQTHFSVLNRYHTLSTLASLPAIYSWAEMKTFKGKQKSIIND